MLRPECGHDVSTVRVTSNHSWAALAHEHFAEPRDIVGDRALRELRCGDRVSLRLQRFDHRAPTRSIRPCAMDEYNVRLVAHRSVLVSGVWLTTILRRGRTLRLCRTTEFSVAHGAREALAQVTAPRDAELRIDAIQM